MSTVCASVEVAAAERSLIGNDQVEYDVAVVGCGPGGAAYAATVAAAGRSTALIGTGSRHPHGTLELLSGRNRQALAGLGVLDAVLEKAPPCVGTVFRWRAGRFLERPAMRDSASAGWIIDRRWFDPMIRRTAVAAGAIPVSINATSITRAASGWRIAGISNDRVRALRGPTALYARELVLAGGRTSRLAPRCGLHRRIRHRMVAITTWLPMCIPGIGQRLLVDAAPNGWWYALGDGRGTTVGYVTDLDLLAAGVNRIDATWQAACRTASWLPDNARSARPSLRAAVVSEVALPNQCHRGSAKTSATPIPLGDLALAADPLSGHGLVLALGGAGRAAVDPSDYLMWLAQQQAAHVAEEHRLYTAQSCYPSTAFWRRRWA